MRQYFEPNTFMFTTQKQVFREAYPNHGKILDLIHCLPLLM